MDNMDVMLKVGYLILLVYINTHIHKLDILCFNTLCILSTYIHICMIQMHLHVILVCL